MARAIPLVALWVCLAPACTAHRSLGLNIVVEADAAPDAVDAAPDTTDVAPRIPDAAPKIADAAPDTADVAGVPAIPRAKEACPTLSGLTGTNVTILGNSVKIWSGTAGAIGPMVFYWHATNATADEAVAGLGPGTREVVASGGVIAAFNESNGAGTNTGDFTWFTGDFATADEILACAHQQGLVDIRRIHSAGYSPGSCQTAAMVYARAYLASVLCYSGGAMIMGSLPDPKNPPAILGAHGAVGSDIFGIDIASNTLLLENDLKNKGAFVIDCDDGGDHLQSGPARLAGVSGPGWQFFKDHPYKVEPRPYQSLPSTFPAYCKIM